MPIAVQPFTLKGCRYNCPLCGGTESSLVFRHENHLFGIKTECELRRCVCGMLRTSPQPDDTEVGRLYENDSYYTHQSPVGARQRVRAAVQKLQFVNPILSIRLFAEERLGFRPHVMRLVPRYFPLHSAQRLLDFGCGNGRLVRLSNQLGIDAIGVEPDPKARAAASSAGAKVAASLDEVSGCYDRIVVSHVAEHLPSPGKTLAALGSRLSDHGRMLIRVPNASSRQAELFGGYWIGYDMPRHLWHFTPDTLKKLVISANLTVLHCQTIELPDFASASAREMQIAGVTPPQYHPGGCLGRRSGAEGAELVVVCQRSDAKR